MVFVKVGKIVLFNVRTDLTQIDCILQSDRQCAYNVTFRHVPSTVVEVEKH
jgi:hypothetical protein